ncbi:MAG: hypothetical protein QF570_04900 [Myxococcota bacterium]|jgi:hypothetical protein|nr:hypothetical protein [Myxococcota bacterium]
MSPEVLREELDVPSNWRGSDLARTDDWVHRLTPDRAAAGALKRLASQPI